MITQMSRKFSSLIHELRIERPHESVLLLRLLLDESSIGRPEIGGRVNRLGTRPLTVGEISENWRTILRERCISRWASEQDINQFDAKTIEDMLSAMDSFILGDQDIHFSQSTSQTSPR